MAKFVVFAGTMLFSQAAFALLTTNIWINSASGKWETAGNWSSGVSSNGDTANIISNNTSKTVTVDSLSSSGGSSMTISNMLIWGGALGSTNTLQITNATSTPFRILNSLIISNRGVVTMSNFLMRVDGVSGGSNVIQGTWTVLNSGVVTSSAVTVIGTVSSSPGTLSVAGAGSFWQSTRFLFVGFSGGTNTLTVGNGSSVLASNLAVGLLAGSDGNRLTVSGGSLFVTNALSSGALDVRRGTFTFNSGTVNVDKLLLTNGAASSMIFTGGTLISSTTFVTNTQQFAVGNGTNTATFTLDGGVHSFANDLRIRSNAFLTGCGTINANVLVDAGGTVQADCGGTLTFSDIVTNNGLLSALNGTTVNFLSNVVNNGTINAINGVVHFSIPPQNNGTILNATTNTWESGTGGKWETAGNWFPNQQPSPSLQLTLITNASTKTVTIDATTVTSNGVNGCMTISNLTVSAPSGASNTLSLAGAGLGTPLTVMSNLMLDGNAGAVVSNSALSVPGLLYVGKSGASNRLSVINGGTVLNGQLSAGASASSSNNSVLVSGSSSAWSNTTVFIGPAGRGNGLVIGNGADVFDTTGYVGDNGVSSGGSNNTVVVTDSGSTWNNASLLSIGDASAGNALTITNGAAVYDGDSLVGSGGKSNTVMVSGNGALWQSTGTLRLGFNGGATNTLTIGNGGSVVASNATVGSDALSLGNRLIVTNGSLYVTNALGGGVLDFRRGIFSLNGGIVTVDNLLMTNGSGSSSMVFTGGTFTSGSATVSNGQQFVVGSGTTAATFQLLGGVYTFGNGLRIRNNGTLTGCGTINGNVQNDSGGTIMADCGGTLTFTGAVTNRDDFNVINATTVNFLGPVVNSGTINAVNGYINFSSPPQNTGTIRSNVQTSAINNWLSFISGKWETGAHWSAGAPSDIQPALLITNVTSKTVTIDATTTNSPDTLTINYLTVGAPNNTTNTLLLTGAGQTTPLTLLQSLIIDTNGTIVIDNSAMSFPNDFPDLFFNIVVGNTGGNASLIISNGGTLFSTYAEVGAGDTGAANSRNNNVLVTGANSVWNNSADLYVGYGDSSWDNSLIISNGGAVASGLSTLGYDNASSNNSVLVTGTGSVWNVDGELAVGYFSGSSNTLVISAGGTVRSSLAYVGGGGAGGPTSNNFVLVTGSGSVWSNQTSLQMGNESGRNSMVISNGGAVVDDTGNIGSDLSGTNTVLVSGSGSMWQNNTELVVGLYSGSNLLAISGGSVLAGSAIIGQSGDAGFFGLASNNILRVDSGSLFVTNATGNGALTVSQAGGKGSLILNGGSVTVASLIATNGLNSTVTLNGGTLIANSAFVTNGQPFIIGSSTNSATNATYVAISGAHSFASNLVVRQGALMLNSGTVTVNRLLLTNGATSAMVFTGGMLQTKGTAVTNTQQFAVGNGTNAAIFNLLTISNLVGGAHSFANNLHIRNAAFLTGCGTITGTVLIDTGATVQANCGGTLTFTGIVTNNGMFSAVNGTTVNFLSNVVNYGTINGIDGIIHFSNTNLFQNFGTIITNIPPSATDSWASATSGKWETSGNWSRGAVPSIADPADCVTNASTKTVTIDATTGLSNLVNGCMIISNLTVSAPGGAINTLLLSNAGTATPSALQLLQQLVIDTNGAVVLNNSAVLATNNSSIDILVGNTGARASLTITNGGAVFSGSAQVGATVSSSNNTALVTGSGSVWQNSGNLLVGNLSRTNTLNINSGGSVVASNVYVGFGTSSVGNSITVITNGSLYATNALSTGMLDIRRGALTFIGGSVTVDSFVATNGANSVVSLNDGALNAKAAVVTNTQPFVVGDGTDTATYHLLGGVHSFANNVHVVANAFLTGCGTINASVLVDNGGTIQADCGGTLTFTGIVTNNGDLNAINFTTVNFLSNVVNNGTITATNGIVQFLSTLVNNGTLNTNLPPPSATNSWTSGADGKWETSASWSMGNAPSLDDPADLITNASSKTVTIDATTSGGFPGSLTVSNLTVAATLPDINALFLNNAGTTTPLSVLQQLVIDANGVVVVNNSAVLANNNAFVDILVGNTGAGASLTISNGSAVSSGAAQVGVTASSGNNTVLVSGSGSVWQNSGELDLGYAGSSNSLTVTNSGAVLAPNMVVGVSAGSSLNLMTISGGSLTVTNDPGNGALDVRSGTVVLNSGTVTVNQLVLTNDVNSVIQFSGGLLNSSDTLVTNNQLFVVGDGTDAASFVLAPGGLGFHQFGNGLVITNNATVSGNGTIIGTTTILGALSPGFFIGTITTSNDLVLSGATINYDLGITGGNPTGDLTAVNGNLTLGGTLNITDAGGFSNATYTLFTYTGALTYNGVSIGTTPNPSLTYTIDTNVSGQVNLDVAFTAPAGPITGTSPVSVGQTNVSYSISSVSGATTYTWTAPTGATIANGQGSTSITVNFGCSTVSDNVTVTPSNANGSGMPSSFAVTVTSVGAAGGISGSTAVNAGDNAVAYSISSVSGATTYTWTVPAGASVASGQGTTSITVNYGCAAVSDNVTVTPASANGCNGTPGSLAVTITGVDAAGAISGLSALCAGSNGVAYSISSVNGATTYAWTVPAGASIADGQGSTSIDVNWGSISGPVAVTPANDNGCNGTAATLPVTVNPLPTVFNITGGGSYCVAGSPVAVGLDGSQSGVNYQLLLNGNPSGSPVAGTGAALSLGNQTVAGSYTVVAVDATAGCTTNMAGSTTVTLMDPFLCWQLQYFGCTNCPQADAAADPDGDGQNNMAEFLAGTIPTNSASVLRITSLVRSGTDIAVTWSTAGGHTNILQAANGGASGGYNTNNFVDIAASQTIVGGSGDTATNYLDSFGATNLPSRFYRIRLVP